MGPPKENSPPFLFGKNFQANLLVDEDAHPNSSARANEADDIVPQNVLLTTKLFDNPPTSDRLGRLAHILQSSSMPAILPPTAARELGSSFKTRFLEQESDTTPEETETNNLQTSFLEVKPPIQVQDDPTSIKHSTLQSTSNKNVNSSESLPAKSSSRDDKLFESPQTSNDAASDKKNIPEGFENSLDSKEASSSNSESASVRAKEAQNAAFEIAKKNWLRAMTQSQAFDKNKVKNTEKRTLQSISADYTDAMFETEKKKIERYFDHTKVLDNIKDNENTRRALRNSSTASNIVNPPIPQYSDTSTIHSNYEEREELRFFDRAKFIAICGEDFFDQSQEPWPQDVKLYQPYEVEQVILPDNSNCLAVQAFLKMCGLDFQTEQRHNAEYMSPSGRVPFIKCGAFVVSELDPIIAFINTKGISLTSQLDAGQRADMRAYMSLANTVLANAELYVAWVDTTTANAVTRPRYGSVHPWPLNHIVTWQKGRQVRKRLAVLGWLQKSLQEVYAEVENCCNALSERLDKKDFFFGSRPTELDALVFGHLFTVLTTPLPSNRLASIVRGYPALVELVKRIEKQFFQREN